MRRPPRPGRSPAPPAGAPVRRGRRPSGHVGGADPTTPRGPLPPPPTPCPSRPQIAGRGGRGGPPAGGPRAPPPPPPGAARRRTAPTVHRASKSRPNTTPPSTLTQTRNSNPTAAGNAHRGPAGGAAGAGPVRSRPTAAVG